MPLSDAQIERYSRQIILPEIGGAGQERLLAATVEVHGAGPLAAMAARYLAGGGVGHLRLVDDDGDAAALCAELAALNPECIVTRGAAASVAVTLALDLPLAVLDGLVRAGGPQLIAAGGAARCAAGWAAGWAGDIGWLHSGNGGCAGCAARAAAPPTTPGLLAAPATGALAALAVLAALRVLLDLAPDDGARWWHFNAAAAALESRPLARNPDCGGCAPSS